MNCTFQTGAYLFLAAATATGLIYTLIYLLAILARAWRLRLPPADLSRLAGGLADDLLNNKESQDDRSTR